MRDDRSPASILAVIAVIAVAATLAGFTVGSIVDTALRAVMSP
jgi:FlaG/FlaF family flagellin (archaellin)